MNFRRLATIGLIALLAAGALTNAGQAPARADGGLNSASSLAINVPGSLLTAAAPNSTLAATLANGSAYNWQFSAPAYATISGTSTSAPAPVDTLSPAEQEAWEDLLRRFRAPATSASYVLKGTVAALGFTLGWSFGNGLARANGFDDDDVCQTQDTYTIVLASVLNGADCSVYENQIPEPQQNSDQMVVQPGSSACITTYSYCWAFQGSAAYILSQNKRQLCFDVSGTRPPGFTSEVAEVVMGDGTQLLGQISSGGAFGYCAQVFGSGATDAAAWGTGLHNPIVSWRIRLSSATSSTVYSTSTPYLPSDATIPNPQRTWRCDVRATDGQTYSMTSAGFGEADANLAPVQCPTLPTGKYPNRIRIYQVLNGVATLVYSASTTAAFNSWLSAYPECRNGSCLLDLRKNGASCFADGIDCSGWVSDPQRATTYTCRYGTHSIALSECFVYGTSFDGNDGFGYGDPSTGAPVTTQTSPTEIDRVTRALLDRGWLVYGPTGAGYEYGKGDEYARARAVATICVQLGVEDDCDTLPIFAPGDDVWQAAKHDLDTIVSNPSLVVLQYANPPPFASRWWVPLVGTYPPAAACGGYYGPEQQCDEYPYRSTAQAGPPLASLRLVDAVQNGAEGTLLGLFYWKCGVETGDLFLVLPGISQVEPVPPQAPATFTSAWC